MKYNFTYNKEKLFEIYKELDNYKYKEFVSSVFDAKNIDKHILNSKTKKEITAALNKNLSNIYNDYILYEDSIKKIKKNEYNYLYSIIKYPVLKDYIYLILKDMSALDYYIENKKTPGNIKEKDVYFKDENDIFLAIFDLRHEDDYCNLDNSNNNAYDGLKELYLETLECIKREDKTKIKKS